MKSVPVEKLDGLVTEAAERLVIVYANLSGRESANRSAFRMQAADIVRTVLSQAIQAAVEEDRQAIYEEVSTEFAKSPLCKRKDRDADKFYLKVLSIIHKP